MKVRLLLFTSPDLYGPMPGFQIGRNEVYGATAQGYRAHVPACSHLSEWGLPLRRTVSKKRPIRLRGKNGSCWRSSAIRCDGQCTGPDHPRSGRSLLPERTRSLPAVSQTSIPPPWFRLLPNPDRTAPEINSHQQSAAGVTVPGSSAARGPRLGKYHPVSSPFPNRLLTLCG
jgi:hypothetical protein